MPTEPEAIKVQAEGKALRLGGAASGGVLEAQSPHPGAHQAQRRRRGGPGRGRVGSPLAGGGFVAVPICVGNNTLESQKAQKIFSERQGRDEGVH